MQLRRCLNWNDNNDNNYNNINNRKSNNDIHTVDVHIDIYIFIVIHICCDMYDICGIVIFIVYCLSTISTLIFIVDLEVIV